MKQATELSPEAANLYSILKGKTVWESDMIKAIFPEPKYPADKNPEGQRIYWQWDVNLYGGERQRPVGKGFEKFTCPFAESYYNKVYPLFKELKAAGMAYAHNCGYNEFSYTFK